MTTSEDRQAHWQQVWTSKAPETVSWFQDDPAPSLALIDEAGIGPGDGIVDIGGGASTLVDRLLGRNFRDLTVLDMAEAALERARARLGDAAAGVEWIAADVTRWRPARTWRLWHDRAAFHFLTAEGDRLAYRHALEAALEEGGHAIVATFAPDGPERCSGLPVMRHDAASLAEALGPSFTLLAERDEEHRTPAGGSQRFRWFLLERVAYLPR